MLAKTQRNSALVGNPTEFEQIDLYTDISNHIKTHTTARSDLGLCALAGIIPVLERGYSLNHCVALLARLQPDSIRPTNQKDTTGSLYVLKTPVHLLEFAPYTHTLFLESDTAKLLIHVANQSPSALSNHRLMGDPQTLRKRAAQIQKRLIDALKSAIEDFKPRSPKQSGAIQSPITLAAFARALNNRALTHFNIAPAIKSARQSDVLPVDADLLSGSFFMDGCDRFTPNQIEVLEREIGVAAGEPSKLAEQFRGRMMSWSTLYAQYLEQNGIDCSGSFGIQDVLADQAQQTLFYQFASDSCEDRPKGWIKCNKEIIAKYRKKLSELGGQTRYITESTYEDALQEIQTFLRIYEDAMGPFSAVTLGLFWISERVLRQHINVETACDYLNAVITHSALFHSMAHDMRLWDEECLAEFYEQLDGIKQRPTTKQKREGIAHQFLRYAQQRGMIINAHIPSLGQNYASYKRRNRILMPDDIDRALLKTSAKGFASTKDQAFFAVTMLGYYAGLRSDEVYSLMLDKIDVYESVYRDGEYGVGDKPHIAIKVIRGKTRNAKRTVHLHVHAPAAILTAFVDLIAARRAMFRKDRSRKRIKLIGEKKDGKGYVSSALKYQTIVRIKSAFGADIDAHTLRHNFATWLDIRYQLANTPDLVDVLNVPYEHEMFAPESLQSLLNYLKYGTPTRDAEHASHHYNLIAMMMGHGSIATTHQHYTHSFAMYGRIEH